MRAIILLGHGSRVPGAGKDMERAVELLKEKYNLEMVISCNMSRLGPHFPETLEKCVKEGAKEIIVIPYFLNMGLHIRLDIPEMMQEEAKKYPGIKLIYGKQLGYDDLFVDILYKRINESKELPDVRELKLEPRDEFPVPDGQGEFVEMAPEEARHYSEKQSHSHSHSHGH
ncbi:MAG: CbiX/SirB N-terminal domain-containing protein [Deltaproteobacteria bacterium]|nr:CbiX/SirB N-terminal domain-containing protein [Deltaproteobacteria bacterium]